MKNVLVILALFMLVVSCNDDEEDTDNPPTVEEYTYKGSTDQNEEIIIKKKGNVITGIRTRFLFSIPGGVNYVDIDRYDSDGICSFTNNKFTYTFPAPGESGWIEEGSVITAELDFFTFEGSFTIDRKDDPFTLQGDFTAELY